MRMADGPSENSRRDSRSHQGSVVAGVRELKCKLDSLFFSSKGSVLVLLLDGDGTKPTWTWRRRSFVRGKSDRLGNASA